MKLTQKIFFHSRRSNLALADGCALIAQQAEQTKVNEARIQVTTELVLRERGRRDKKGNLVRDLKRATLRYSRMARSRRFPHSI